MPIPGRPTDVAAPFTPVIWVVRSPDGFLMLWTHPDTGQIHSAHGYPYN